MDSKMVTMFYKDYFRPECRLEESLRIWDSQVGLGYVNFGLIW